MTKEELNDFNIFALRELARRVGVSMPTSKKKDVLIKEILEIQAGTRAPYFPTTKQGRPPKSNGITYAGGFKDGIRLEFKPANSMPALCLRQTPTEEFKHDDVLTYNGFVELFENQLYFWTYIGHKTGMTMYPILPKVLTTYPIKNGDSIFAQLELIDDHVVTSDFFSVNGVHISLLDGERPEELTPYSQITHQDVEDEVDFGDKFADIKINKGENILFSGINHKNNTKSLLELLQSADVDKKFYINISLMEKEKSALPKVGRGIEFFVTDLTEKSEITERMLALAVSSIKRCFETKKSVMVVIDDVDSLQAIKSNGVDFARTLLSLCKYNSDYGSITTLAVVSNENQAFTRIADRQYLIDEEKILHR